MVDVVYVIWSLCLVWAELSSLSATGSSEAGPATGGPVVGCYLVSNSRFLPSQI